MRQLLIGFCQCIHPLAVAWLHSGLQTLRTVKRRTLESPLGFEYQSPSQPVKVNFRLWMAVDIVSVAFKPSYSGHWLLAQTAITSYKGSVA